MPLPRLIAIKAYRAGTYTVSSGDEVKPSSGTNDLWPQVLSHKRADHLREASALTLEIMRGSTWHVEDVLSVRDRLVVEYDSTGNGAADFAAPYRIRTISLGTGEASGLKIEAWSLDTDLVDYSLQVVQAPQTSVVRYKDFDRWRLDDVLTTLFDSDYGLPPAFALGTVESALAPLEVSVYANASTFAELLRALSEEVRRHETTIEYETVYSIATGTLTFHFYRERGWSSAERAAGSPNPGSRLIKAPTGEPGSGAGRLFNRVADAQDDYHSRLIPTGGASEEEQIGVGGIAWPIASAVFAGGETVVTFTDDCVPFDDMFAGGGFLLRSDTASYPIVAAAAPNQITVQGNASAETALRFISSGGASQNGIGTDVDYVQRPDGEPVAGVVYRSEWLRDIPPYANLFEEAGGSGDMSTWSSVWAPRRSKARRSSHRRRSGSTHGMAQRAPKSNATPGRAFKPWLSTSCRTRFSPTSQPTPWST